MYKVSKNSIEETKTKLKSVLHDISNMLHDEKTTQEFKEKQWDKVASTIINVFIKKFDMEIDENE